MTASSLRNCRCRDLAQMAKSRGVAGWHSMRKEELVRALVRQAREGRKDGRRRAASRTCRDAANRQASAGGKPQSRAQQRLVQLRAQREADKNLSLASSGVSRRAKQDRLVVMVRGPYWLHAYWELAARSVGRAQSAMGPHWHTTRPVLRVYRVSSEGTAILDRDIQIHGGVNHWYISVDDPPSQFRMEIGYLAPDGRFFCLARSNSVTTPPGGTSDSVDRNWAEVDEHADRIYAMSGGYSPQGTSLELQELLEERLQRPMGTPMKTRYGGGAARAAADAADLQLAVDAELLVYGVSDPHAHVTLQGEPVTLHADGSFVVRMALPDRRQVMPIVASSADGVEQRTIILAVERNTKTLELVVRDPGS
jgi:hypothetical protein